MLSWYHFDMRMLWAAIVQQVEQWVGKIAVTLSICDAIFPMSASSYPCVTWNGLPNLGDMEVDIDDQRPEKN